ncbi:TetR/AcrR family transcriptional regulator [Leifsonia sp. TF02-11]|uniref:TetR/AcrR family transcriptional regulator n=1 Tax=Leifsonia sp. TF02-11 TaxID=2815212 RepID=UPI001AA14645|nr:TetR/AcrR family transcriptional regulator [Leifsonia sp. TF02-11]MBO1738618.1 TetR/AcrR family transcriptional regulator [Leifsonia sp. TF02-11]
MDLDESPARRRRGAELEAALLDAAWAELDENGYSALTMEGVAARAGTSRPVIARRWPTRSELALAAVRHHFDAEKIELPDHGNLRDDLIDYLRQANARRSQLVGPLMLRFSGIVSDSEGGIAGLREQLIGGRPTMLDAILERASARGELDRRALPPIVSQLPFTLLRHELLMRMAPADDDTIVAIVDDVFLPLVARYPSAR